MFPYSFPNEHDDFRTRLTYEVAAEFIYRLDELLEYEHETNSPDGCVPVEIMHVVMECAGLALDMLHGLEGACADAADMGKGQFVMAPGTLSVVRPDTADIVRGAVQAINAVPGELAPGCESRSASPMKAHLLATLGKEFFAQLSTLCESVTAGTDGTVGEYDANMVRACVDAAMGMVHELKLATWPEGSNLPATVFLAMRDHVTSYRLECAGAVAMRIMENVYDVVAQELREEA